MPVISADFCSSADNAIDPQSELTREKGPCDAGPFHDDEQVQPTHCSQLIMDARRAALQSESANGDEPTANSCAPVAQRQRRW
jgi:hypothetical protein